MKLRLKTTIRHEGEVYKFVNGEAIVPGMWHRSTNRPCTITIKEFKELTNEIILHVR